MAEDAARHASAGRARDADGVRPHFHQVRSAAVLGAPCALAPSSAHAAAWQGQACRDEEAGLRVLQAGAGYARGRQVPRRRPYDRHAEGDGPGLRAGAALRARDACGACQQVSAARRGPPHPPIRGRHPQRSTKLLDRLTDTSLYTGHHRHRFDVSGRGRGLAGRDSIVKGGAESTHTPQYYGGNVQDLSQIVMRR